MVSMDNLNVATHTIPFVISRGCKQQSTLDADITISAIDGVAVTNTQRLGRSLSSTATKLVQQQQPFSHGIILVKLPLDLLYVPFYVGAILQKLVLCALHQSIE